MANGQVIGWDETKPANGDQIASGDDQIRSDKTALRTALDDEHVFPSSGGTAGYHRYGSARAFFDVESNVSSAGTDGRLMVSSDNSRLFHVGSNGTMHLGGFGALLGIASNSGYTLGPQHYYAIDITGGQSSSTGMINHTFASAFSGTPVTFIQSDRSTSGLGTVYEIWTVTASTFQARSLLTDWATATGNKSYVAISIGTRLLG